MEKFVETLGMLAVPHFTVHLDEVKLRTGKLSRRIKIEHPRAVAVVPLIDESHILMVRQYRYAIGEDTLEIPAGKVDGNENIKEAALRELHEETGYSADKLKHLLSYYPAIAYSNEAIDIFCAVGLNCLSEPLDKDEIASVEHIAIPEALHMVRSGIISDGKTIIALLSLQFFDINEG